MMLRWNLGVMQDYYQQNVFGNDYPNIVVLLSLTGTLSLVFTNGCASLVQILISYVGVTWSMTIGSLLLSMGLIFAGFSTQVRKWKSIPIVESEHGANDALKSGLAPVSNSRHSFRSGIVYMLCGLCWFFVVGNRRNITWHLLATILDLDGCCPSIFRAKAWFGYGHCYKRHWCRWTYRAIYHGRYQPEFGRSMASGNIVWPFW